MPHFFTKIFIPQGVFYELTQKNTPVAIRKSLQSSPGWIEILEVKKKMDESLNHLDKGEQERSDSSFGTRINPTITNR